MSTTDRPARAEWDGWDRDIHGRKQTADIRVNPLDDPDIFSLKQVVDIHILQEDRQAGFIDEVRLRMSLSEAHYLGRLLVAAGTGKQLKATKR